MDMLLQQPQRVIKTEEELRTYIPHPISLVAGKKIPFFSEADKSFIAHSPFLCMTTRGADGAVNVSVHGGKPGFVRVLDEKTLLVPLYAERLSGPQEDLLALGEIALIFLIPTMNDTLRVTGLATVISDARQLDLLFPAEERSAAALQVEIVENYIQCPKALVRSQLWAPEMSIVPEMLAQLEETSKALTAFDANCQSFLEHAPFMFLGTSNGDGEADVSPRGDPRGAFKLLNEKVLLIGDRPGNRLVDSHRNVLQYPRVGLIFLIPGLSLVLTVQGHVRLTTDDEILELLIVQEKKPVLGVWVEIESVFLSHSQALERAGIWEPQTYPDPKTLPTFATRAVGLIKSKVAIKLGIKSDRKR